MLIIKFICIKQRLLNVNQDGYEELKSESNPIVLSLLIWHWLDHLKVSNFLILIN